MLKNIWRIKSSIWVINLFFCAFLLLRTENKFVPKGSEFFEYIKKKVLMTHNIFFKYRNIPSEIISFYSVGAAWLSKFIHPN